MFEDLKTEITVAVNTERDENIRLKAQVQQEMRALADSQGVIESLNGDVARGQDAVQKLEVAMSEISALKEEIKVSISFVCPHCACYPNALHSIELKATRASWQTKFGSERWSH